MGYRSRIVAAFYSQTPTDIEGDVEVAKARNIATLDMFMRENFPSDALGDIERITTRHGRVVWQFTAEDVKWYESYPEVQKFEEFWERFCSLANWEDGKGEDPVFWSCEFMRLGENDDDVESRASTDAEWLLRLSRSIETDY